MPPGENSQCLQVGNEGDKISRQRIEVSKRNPDHIGSERMEFANQARPRKRIEVKIQTPNFVFTGYGR
jgi:hypothetical protein